MIPIGVRNSRGHNSTNKMQKKITKFEILLKYVRPNFLHETWTVIIKSPLHYKDDVLSCLSIPKIQRQQSSKSRNRFYFEPRERSMMKSIAKTNINTNETP